MGSPGDNAIGVFVGNTFLMKSLIDQKVSEDFDEEERSTVCLGPLRRK